MEFDISKIFLKTSSAFTASETSKLSISLQYGVFAAQPDELLKASILG
ncbi:hypothetical protein E4N72_11025 [Treponema vincentii]|nr:hypothetical protein E4N72_11025 [Treponema vincentii]